MPEPCPRWTLAPIPPLPLIGPATGIASGDLPGRVEAYPGRMLTRRTRARPATPWRDHARDRPIPRGFGS
ncbi:hypothetical protein Afil01_13690 [Actinorhabdospora filicis]|uniref:Uncharacterized protein n=1 Tax=Actinorhabdospora filicis TaxID=1785913 RepID=A0A9W6SIQ6_9ACTN|nr:hypothetical protein Afil01_13690 [Actinorhabdospora filicis]